MKEDAIEYFEFHRKIFCEDHLKICPKDSIAYQATLKEKEFYDLAIKALKRESSLEKIKERIELEKLGYPPSAGYYRAIMKCLQIIDKYRAESEDGE